jgi:hypothetical protein
MNVRAYGSDKRLEFCREYLLSESVRSVKAITLLPIPSTRDGITLHGMEVTLDEVVGGLSSSEALVGYGLPCDLRRRAGEIGAVAIDVERDGEYLAENAYLTAVGTLGRILTEEIRSPHELSVGVIGYGRIGERLVHMLMFLGARVTVFTSKSELRSELCMLGISGVDSGELDSPAALERLTGLDIIVNTAPAPLLPDSAARIISGRRVIELASGNNLPDSIYYERISALPASMYPRSAGIALARSVLRMLGEAKDV